MIAESKISSKNQVTLPKEIMLAVGLKASDRIVFQFDGQTLRILPKNSHLADLRNRFPHGGQVAVSIEEMQHSIEAHQDVGSEL